MTAVKLYPAGATTNSDAGVRDLARVAPVLEAMQEVGLPLLVHGEVTDPDVDIFDREAVFIERVLAPLRRDFPALRVVLEHVTTRQGVDYVRGGPEATGGEGALCATITPHHLMINRTDIFRGGIRPHLYCLPIAKREEHRLALRDAATCGDARFFLGTDSAPHPGRRQGKRLRLRRRLQRSRSHGLLRAGLRGGGQARCARRLRLPARPGLLRP